MTQRPTPFLITDVTLSDIAAAHGCDLVGQDGPVDVLSLVRANLPPGATALTYVGGEAYVEMFEASDMTAAIIDRRFVRDSAKTLLVADDGTAESVFFDVHTALSEGGRPQPIAGDVSGHATIHPAATVMDNVVVEPGAVVDAGVVLYPNTVVSSGAHVMANTVIGGDGFEVKRRNGRLARIPHVGGTWIGPDVTIGSATTIDRALFGTWTEVGPASHIDNNVYIAHNVVIGSESAITGGSSILGSSVVGDGVWIGPRTVCNPEIVFGDHAFVGSGSVVIDDVPPFTLVAGSPARVLSEVCRCRSRISVGVDPVTCENCGTSIFRTGQGSLGIAD